MPNRLIDLTDRKIGRWTVLGRAADPLKWTCRCECGRSLAVFGGSLRSGESTSCGCGRRDRMVRHGRSKTPEYQAWTKMIARCEGGGARAVDWGGRGIRVDPVWRSSFEAFLAAVGPRPSPDHSIERIDNDGDYRPGNVRWASALDQSNNRRNNIVLAYHGQKMTLAQACRAAGVVSYRTAYARVRRGSDPLWAVTTPTA